ncbi:hypothetical protein EC912_101447 [Luteibacter rhizovicinus]|uniref:Antibiotic biosynthesis monooxygenase n=1 Tax=Luteibacter rhizovicinus TaxID=242606 RepID=A0A4R3YWA0_9GAMM|nr:antibiotic biosynthesis monooxygenase [Luteibacter rhizovicinus]TCV97435.1 hypothetical protein EC912_101447 [Luteibacter rhizovicinus]
MATALSVSPALSVFRIDRFTVPEKALGRFVAQLRQTQQALDLLPGCLQNLVLTQPAVEGAYGVMTVVEWADEDAFVEARAVMRRTYDEVSFDPMAFMTELGVTADMGTYHRLIGM